MLQPTTDIPIEDCPAGVAVAEVSGWGWCAVSATAHGVAGAVIGSPDRNGAISAVSDALGDRYPGPVNAEAGLAALLNRLAGHPAPSVDLDLEGTRFQRDVWAALTEIEAGETTTYGDLALRLGRTAKSARAIGSAVGANPALVFVPCHRVLPADGSLGIFRLGTDVKRQLLATDRCSDCD